MSGGADKIYNDHLLDNHKDVRHRYLWFCKAFLVTFVHCFSHFLTLHVDKQVVCYSQFYFFFSIVSEENSEKIALRIFSYSKYGHVYRTVFCYYPHQNSYLIHDSHIHTITDFHLPTEFRAKFCFSIILLKYVHFKTCEHKVTKP